MTSDVSLILVGDADQRLRFRGHIEQYLTDSWRNNILLCLANLLRQAV